MPGPDPQPEKPRSSTSCAECGAPHLLSRRTVLKSALGVGLGLPLVGLAARATEDLRRARPQMGDVCVCSRLETARDKSLHPRTYQWAALR